MALGNIAITLPVQADNTLGTRWRTPGSKSPGSPVLQWGSLSSLANAIADRATGSGAFSFNVRALLSGTGAATAAISIVYVSGSSVSNWSIVGDNIQHAGSVAGAGFFVLRATPVGSNSLDSVVLGWSWHAPAGDTAKPARVTGISITPANSALNFLWDASSDSSPPGVTPSGMKDYQLYKAGLLVATIPALSPGVPFAFTSTQIGSYSPSPAFGYAASNDGEWSLTSAGTGWHNTATEQHYFHGTTVSGNFTVIAQVAQFLATGSYQFSTAGLMIRETRAQGAPLFSLYQEPSNVAPRVQCKRRPTWNANAVNVAQTSTLGSGALRWLKAERIGDVFNGYYSTDGVEWTLLVSQTISMASSVEVGLAVASQVVGSAVTAIFRNFSVTTAPQVAYTLNNATGTALYTIIARDLNLNAAAASPGVSGTPLAGPPQTFMKFAPGHYVWPSGAYAEASQRTGWQTAVNEIAGSSDFKGINISVYWKYLETAQGNYTGAFEIIDSLLAMCDAATPKKKLMFQIAERGFGGSWADQVLPQYIRDAGLYIQNETGTWSGGLKCSAKLWDPVCMGHLINLYKAIGTRYNDHPLFIMQGAGETALDGSPGDPGFTHTAYFAQLQRLFTEVKPFFNKTPLRLNGNFFGITTAQYLSFVDAIVNATPVGGVVIGGPDPEFRPALIGADPANAQRAITINELHRGNTRNAANTAWQLGGGHDYRDEIAWIGEQQAFGFEGVRTGYNETVSDIYNYQRNTMKAKYMSWMFNTWAGNTAQRWSTGIKPYVQSINGAINTTKPTIGNWEDPA